MRAPSGRPVRSARRRGASSSRTASTTTSARSCWRGSSAAASATRATPTRFQREAQAGLIHVNSQTAGAEVHVPFGGIKSSGFGPHEQGRAAIEFYTEVVTVYVDP